MTRVPARPESPAEERHLPEGVILVPLQSSCSWSMLLLLSFYKNALCSAPSDLHETPQNVLWQKKNPVSSCAPKEKTRNKTQPSGALGFGAVHSKLNLERLW